MSFVYHASPSKELSIIHPQPTQSNSKYIGDYVFATSNKKLATMYLLPKGVEVLFTSNSTPPSITINANLRDYLLKDEGGSIYKLSDDGFEASPQKGLEQYEKVRKQSVTPIDEEQYESTLQAMRSMGITIYFVDNDTFRSIIDSKDEASIFATLTPYQHPI